MKQLLNNVFGIKKHRIIFLICISALAALIGTAITYPGIMYSDSFSRWYMANNFARGEFSANSNWLSIFPQFIMTLCFKLTGEYGSFTFLMAFMFWASSLLLVDAYLPKFKAAAVIILIFCPIFYGYSVFVEMGLGVVVGINIFLLIFEYFPLKSYAAQPLIKKLLFYLLCAFSYLMVFGYRQNAITVLPVFLFVMYFEFKSGGLKLMLIKQLALIFALMVCIALIPKAFNFKEQYNVTSVGFLWDTIKMLEKLQNKPEYDNYLDFLGENATKIALESNNHDTINGYAARIPYELIGKPELANAINRRFVKLALKEPLVFIQTKAATIGKIMGFYGPLHNWEYQYNAYEKMPEYNYSDTPLRMAFFNSYMNFQELFPVFRVPIIWFAAALILGLAVLKKGDKQYEYKNIILFFMACFYYGAFLINAQSAEFRYFFPAFYLLLLSCIASLGRISFRFKKIK